MHFPRHKQMLKEATEETLPAVVAQIREENPEAFHVVSGENETLSHRKFFDDPCRPTPMASFVCAYVPSPPTETKAKPTAVPPSKDEKKARAKGRKGGATAKGVQTNAEIGSTAKTHSEPVSTL